MPRREPSCTLNHNVQRRELHDKGIPFRDCPSCGWTLKAFPNTAAEDRRGERENQMLIVDNFLIAAHHELDRMPHSPGVLLNLTMAVEGLRDIVESILKET